MRVVNPSVDKTQHLTNGWADYRRRQWVAGLMTIGFIPLAALIGLDIESLTRSDRLIAPFVAPLAIIMFGAWSWFVLFRCPNCRRHFHVTDAWRLTNGRQCPHCGLERYQIN